MRYSVAALLLALSLSFAGCKSDPATPEHWDKRISDGKNGKGKVKAVEDLRSSKYMSPAMLPMLRKHLESEKSAEVKGALARLLGEQKDKEAVDALIAAADLGASERPEKEMNVEIGRALGLIGDPKGVPTLLKLLNSKDLPTAIEGVESLGALKAKEAVAPLIDLVASEGTQNFVTKKAIVALGNIGDPKAVPILVKMMFKDRAGASFYMESSFALYQLGAPAADALVPVLEEKDKELLDWANKSNIKTFALPLKAAQVLGDLHDMRAEKGLVALLGFKSEFDDIRLMTRMRAADALGRMRSKEGGKVLATMLDEEEPSARSQYIKALIRIGTHEAVPKLIEAASKGGWDAREEAMIGVARLGDDKDVAAFEKFAASEQKLFEAECKDYPDFAPCKDLPGSMKKHLDRIAELKKGVEGAKECKDDPTCWAKKLDSAETGVRERAAYEVGRGGKAELVGELLKRLGEKNLDARVAFIQGADWLIHDSKDALKTAQASVPAIEKQLEEDRGKNEFVIVNEDLRRLLVKIQRG